MNYDTCVKTIETINCTEPWKLISLEAIIKIGDANVKEASFVEKMVYLLEQRKDKSQDYVIPSKIM